jgi:hypothetical protein
MRKLTAGHTLLALSFLLVLAAPIAAVAVAWTESREGTALITVDRLRTERVTLNESHDVFVVTHAGRALALSAFSPYRNTGLVYCVESRDFAGVWGERFDRRGFYYGGPAPRGMDRYRTWIDNGVVYADLGEAIPGPERGAGPPLKPKGAFCTTPGGPPAIVPAPPQRAERVRR